MGRVLRWTLGLAAVLLVIFVAINAFDEDPSPVAKQLATPAPNPLKPEENLYLALMGFAGPSGTVPIEAGQARVAEYETRKQRSAEMMKTAPQIEAEYSQLNRDYGIHKKNYEDLVKTGVLDPTKGPSRGILWRLPISCHSIFRPPVAPSVIFSSPSVLRYSRSMPNSGTKRPPKMVTIHSLDEMKAAVQQNDSLTKMLVLGLGEAIVTTCGMARVFLGNAALLGDEPKGPG